MNQDSPWIVSATTNRDTNWMIVKINRYAPNFEVRLHGTTATPVASVLQQRDMKKTVKKKDRERKRKLTQGCDGQSWTE